MVADRYANDGIVTKVEKIAKRSDARRRQNFPTS
jgi:hypothetical protein